MSSVVNPFELGPTGLLAWGLVAHAIADFALQNEWLAIHKVERGGWSRRRNAVRLSRDPTEVFLIRQTQPKVPVTTVVHPTLHFSEPGAFEGQRATVLARGPGAPIIDIGALVRFNLDQVFHLATIAVAAVAVTVL